MRLWEVVVRLITMWAMWGLIIAQSDIVATKLIGGVFVLAFFLMEGAHTRLIKILEEEERGGDKNGYTSIDKDD